jgi:hypothetical protein
MHVLFHISLLLLAFWYIKNIKRSKEKNAFMLQYLVLLNRLNGTIINMKASSEVNIGIDFR